MLRSVVKRILPPVIASEEQDRWRGAVLRRIMLGDMLVSSAALGVGFVVTPDPRALAVLIGALLIWALALTVTSRWLSVRLGSLLYLGGGAVFISLLSAISSGAHSPTFPAFVVLLLSAAYLFERRTLLLFAVFILLCMAAVLAADLTTVLPAPLIPHEPIVVWFSTVAIAVLLTARLWDFTRLARDTLARAQAELQERRRAEAQLVASEERFRRLFETMPDSYFAARLDGKVLLANQAAAELLGYPVDELLGLNVREQLYASPPEWERLLSELEHNGRVRGFEVILRRKDGGEMTVEANVQLLRDPDGRAYAIEGVQRDITPRIRAEQELRRNQQLLEQAQQVGNIGHFVVDVATQNIAWSSQMYRLHGMMPDEEPPDFPLAHLPPEDAARWHETLRTIQPGQQPSLEHWLFTTSGERRRVLTTMRMVYDEKGAARTVLGTMLDISRLKQAEEGLRVNAERLAVFNEIGRSVATQQNLTDVLEAIYAHLQNLLQLDTFFVALFDPATGLLSYPIVYDGGKRYTQASQLLTPLSTSGRVIESGQAVLTIRTAEQIARIPAGGLGDTRRVSASLIHVPLVVAGRTVGVLSAQSYSLRAYDSSHVDLLMGIANQTAVAIRNAQLFEAQQQELAERRTAEERLALQNDIGRVITSVQSLDEVLERILKNVGRSMPVDAFFVSLYDQPRNTLTYPLLYDSGKRYTRGPETLTPGSATWRTIIEDRRILILRTPDEVANARSERIGEDRPSASLIYVPMNVEGRVLGAISAQSYAFRAYDEGHVALLAGVADQAAIAIRNAQLFAEARQELVERRIAEERLESLNEISRAISTVRGLSDVLDVIYHQVRRMIPHDVFYVALFDEAAGLVSFPIYCDGGERRTRHSATLPGDSLFDRVLRQGEAILLNRTPAQVAAAPELQNGEVQRATASLLLAPLVGTLRIVGLISVQSHTPGRYDEQDLDLLKGVAYQTEIAIESARLLHALGTELGQRRRAEVERERLIGELEDRNIELEQFTYTVSHDLKSPLITVLGFLGYLAEDAASGNQERLRQDIQRIVDATNRMQRLLDELLELSRIGRQVNEAVDVPFEAIVREARALVRGRLKARGVEVRVENGMPVVHGDRIRLVEVMQNLLDNGAKFMGDQASPRIEVGTRLGDGGSTIFTVNDNGIGIEAQHQQRVFGLFDKLDPHTEGTGVGLALVKRIIDVHGGRIWVESEGTGHGSTFCFTLPLAAPPVLGSE